MTHRIRQLPVQAWATMGARPSGNGLDCEVGSLGIRSHGREHEIRASAAHGGWPTPIEPAPL